jgi:predicted kinase
MRTPPTLFLLCGLPGAGKTTLARELERSAPALRLTPDDWIAPLYGDELTRAELDACRDPVEAVQWAVAARALQLGVNAILDFGFWTRSEREEFRHRAAALGARSSLRYVAVERATLWARLEARNAALPPHTFLVTFDQFQTWWEMFEPPVDGELIDREPPSLAQ